MPEIKTFLVLSTGHLKNEIAKWLNQVILEDARFISGLSDERIENSPVVGGYAEFGYFLYCDEEAQDRNWPEDLVAVMQNARKQGTEYLLLDRDVVHIEELEP
jgi:hypothetical protein